MTTSTLNRDAQLSTLANAAYLDNPPQQIGDWSRVGDPKASSSGFFGVAYVNNVTKQVVLAFRGTDGLSDLKPDTTFSTGGWSQQFTDAAAFTASVKTAVANTSQYQGYQLLTTGHSLGGGIAQIIGQMFGLGGATYEAPGALSVTSNPQYAAVKMLYAIGIGGKIAADFTNYRAEGSVISGTGATIGSQQNMVNLNLAGAVGFASAVLMLGGVATGGLGGLVTMALGYAGVNIDSLHSMDGMERTMYIAAGLEKALGTGALKMATISLSQATGQTWTGSGAEPQVMVFQDSNNQVKAYIQQNGSGWKLSTPDQQTSITLTPPTMPGQAPTCIVQEINKPSYSCVVSEAGGTTTRNIDNTGDGKADQIITEHVDGNGVSKVDTKDLNTNGTVKDETITSISADRKSSETKVDTDGNGTWNQVSVGIDTDNNGTLDKNVSINLSDTASITAGEQQVKQQVAQGNAAQSLLADVVATDTSALVNNTATISTPVINNGVDPIGAFYESKSAATDTAASIASKTFRILNGAGAAVTSAQLTALDTNADGKLSGTELNGLTAWSDLNEDGISQTGESTALSTALTNAGLSSVRSSDYAFYTAGNASYRTVAQNTATAPVNSRGGARHSGCPGQQLRQPACHGQHLLGEQLPVHRLRRKPDQDQQRQSYLPDRHRRQ